jgi:signal transduction histidine kinase
MTATTMTSTTAVATRGTRRGFIRQLGADTAYAIVSFPLAIASFVLIVTGIALSAGLMITLLGLPILAVTIFIARGMADLHRIAIAGVLNRPSPRPAYRKSKPGAGWFRRVWTPIKDGQSWLDISSSLIDFPFAAAAFAVTVAWWAAALGGTFYGFYDWSIPQSPDNKGLNDFLGFGHSTAARIGVNTAVGIIFLITLPLVMRLLTLMRAHMNRALLCGVAEMRHQIEGLQVQKQAAVSAEATALRRLERDIHDGPQQRLVRLAMDLGRARQQMESDPDAARATIEEALGQTRETLDELRALSRGIAPPILADRGLSSALAALAGRNPVPVDLAIASDLGTLPPNVETVAYFVVAESLANIAKHSGATSSTVTVARAGDLLGVVVADDGTGGAHIAKGHGLAGLNDRVTAAGGTLHVTSPIGGPTEIRAEIPCA